MTQEEGLIPEETRQAMIDSLMRDNNVLGAISSLLGAKYVEDNYTEVAFVDEHIEKGGAE